MISLDSQGDHGLHEVIGPKHPGGMKPRRLQTSWGMNGRREPPPPRPTKITFYLDDSDGITVAQADNIDLAYACQRELRKQGKRVFIREYHITEESLQEDSAYQRWCSQHGR